MWYLFAGHLFYLSQTAYCQRQLKLEEKRNNLFEYIAQGLIENVNAKGESLHFDHSSIQHHSTIAPFNHSTIRLLNHLTPFDIRPFDTIRRLNHWAKFDHSTSDIIQHLNYSTIEPLDLSTPFDQSII
jgi:hypothetical protein